MNKLTVDTVYEESEDIIRAYVECESFDEGLFVEIEYHCSSNKIVFDDVGNDFVSKLPILNSFDLVSRVTRALIDATDADNHTDVPMHSNEKVVLYI